MAAAAKTKRVNVCVFFMLQSFLMVFKAYLVAEGDLTKVRDPPGQFSHE